MLPRLVGDGPATCSTCTEVARQPGWIADTNRYYRDLGVPTDASRREIKQAYLDGPKTPRRTFVVKQLLDPVVRRAYDLTPLGSVFVDEYVLSAIRRVKALSATPSAGRGCTPVRIESTTPLDTLRGGEDSPSRTTEWPWSFYLWGTDRPDRTRLAQLQERLVSLLGSNKHHLQVAVGLRGGMGPAVETTVVGRRIVVFLHEDEDLTDAVAQRAASSLTHHLHLTETSRTMAGNFRKGAEESATASKGAQFSKTHYLSIEDGKQEIVRFLTDQDDWIVVDQHNNIQTKGAPADHDGNWPSRMGAVCRKDVAFTGMYADCYICDNMINAKGKPERPTGRTWALACLREEVVENGQVVGIRDKTREVAEVDENGKPTGNTVQERAVIVVNQGYKNFFSTLNGFAGHYGTVLDRDYLIKRKGQDTATTYQIIPLDPITMPDGSTFDTRNPEHAAKYGIKPGMLEDLVSDRASDEFYARFFDKRVAIPQSKRSGGDTAAPAAQPAAPAKPEGNVEQGRLDALASRVKSYGPTDGPTQEPPSDPAGGVPSTGGSQPPKPPTGGMRAFD